jgi:nucleoside 2-deoxyribosyltransferase
MKVYVAGALERRGDAQILAAYLRDEGHVVLSTWHDDRGATRVAERAMSRARARSVWEENRGQIDICDVLVVVASGRETLCECEYALARCKRVIWLDEDSEPPLTVRIWGKSGKLGDVVRLLGVAK